MFRLSVDRHPHPGHAYLRSPRVLRCDRCRLNFASQTACSLHNCPTTEVVVEDKAEDNYTEEMEESLSNAASATGSRSSVECVGCRVVFDRRREWMRHGCSKSDIDTFLGQAGFY
jgi:hypothetical protein